MFGIYFIKATCHFSQLNQMHINTTCHVPNYAKNIKFLAAIALFVVR